MKKPVLFSILLLGIVSCAPFRQAGLEISYEEVENAEAIREIAYNYLKSWPVFSGLIRGSLGPQMSELPAQAVDAMDELDELAKRLDECSDHELGYSLGLKIRLLSAVVIETLDFYAPELLRYVPIIL